MLLYHGTAYDRSFTGNGDIRLIGTGEFGGSAFYLSYGFKEAQNRAYLNAQQGIGEMKDTRVLKFELDDSGVEVYDFGDYSPEWLEFVYSHEMQENPDVIIGGLVDEMGLHPGLLQEWLISRKRGQISKEYTNSVVSQLKTDIKLQIAIKTQKGVDAMKFLGSEDV